MEVVMARPISKRQADRLWDDLRGHFVAAQDAIKAIIKAEAWKPLGYDTFAEAWTARMGDVTLATEARPHVVYQMLAEGVPADDVALATKGVGPETVRELDRQRKNGVPADHAVVRRHLRRRPSAPDTLHVKLTAATLTEYHRVAAAAGVTVEEVAREAIAERFAVMVKAQAGGRRRGGKAVA
ncbi:hypothetical protein DS6A_49 [Mycobacterium phage DS6A]|uniref:Uncharacterized protein n=1 Tax=Mycobacterium phage DS6A TaxID=45764 RepID=G8I4F9_9CAUD|nr:hypothetical protein DS6A_49 [Mycobacterium phage DS6A]AER47603.1 hypothetical protein DS6A_49 [Mycobacterium phage DS6A]